MRALRTLLLLTALASAACQDSDAVTIRVRLAGDLSGEVFASSLSMPDEPGPLESAAEGVEWDERGRIDFHAGRFADVNALAVEDLRFVAETQPDGLSYVRVFMPRGDDARWFRRFAPADEERRARMARAVDPEGGADRVGATLKLVIETPVPVASAGVHPVPRGVQGEYAKSEASLVVPLEALRATGQELLWSVVW